jgi:cytosine/adenosine deaminase-related metal-dependent hydrolase
MEASHMLCLRNAVFPVTSLHEGRETLTRYQCVDLVVDRTTGRIVSVSEAAAAVPSGDAQPAGIECEVVDATDCLLLPGFVNAHTHSSEHWLRCAIGMYPLELWLDPLGRFAPLSPEHIYLAAQATAAEALLSGCTSVLDHISVPPGRMDLLEAAVRGFTDTGVRLFLAPMVRDEPSVTPGNMPQFGDCSCCTGGAVESSSKGIKEWAAPTQATLDFLEEAIGKLHRPDKGVSLVVAPSGVQWCTTAMLQACIGLASKHGLAVHTHLVETAFQKQLARERPDGHGAADTAAKFLDRVGGLRPATSFAHAVHVTKEDVALLAKTGATVVHNPLSNLRLGSGVAPILDMRDAGVNIALGTDGAASNDAQNMLEVLKQAAILHNAHEMVYDRWLRPAEVVRMATTNGAKALGVEAQLGSLQPGMRADFTLFNLRAMCMLPRTDPLSLLVLGRPEKDAVRGVWVNGRRVVQDGKLLLVSVDKLCKGLWDHPTFLPHSPLLCPEPEYERQYKAALARFFQTK